MLKVLIFGQKWLGVNTLEVVRSIPNIEIVGVVSPANNGENDRILTKAKEYGYNTYTMSSCPCADIALAAHFQDFIPKTIRDRFRLGVLSYHPSLLPRHRGRDAVKWAIHMRESITGGTLYWMDDGADTGKIEAQDFCHIYPNETAEGLWRRALAPMGLKLFKDTLSRLAKEGVINAVSQDERLATFEPAFSNKKLGGCE